MNLDQNGTGRNSGIANVESFKQTVVNQLEPAKRSQIHFFDLM